MAIIEKNREPTAFELRIFGLILAAFFGFIGWLALARFGSTTAAIIWGAALAVVALYYAVPGIRRTMYHGWMTMFFPVGWLVSHALLAIVYYLVLTPVGLLVRLFNRDPLEQEFDREAKSYWMPHTPAPDTSHYFKQF